MAYEMRISDWSSDVCSSDLLVGSECIKRFEITGVDEQGQRLDADATGKLVDRHRRGLVEDARKQRVMTALLKLGQEVDDFDAWDFIDFVDDNGAFTPTQVEMIFRRMGSAGVNYRPAAWQLRNRSNRETGKASGRARGRQG